MTTQLTDDAVRFVTDRHLATLSSMGKSGDIHTVPVGFTLREGVVRIIATDGTQKVRNIERDAITLAENLYAARYRQPQPNPQRVVIRIDVDRVLGSSGMRAAGAASAPRS